MKSKIIFGILFLFIIQSFGQEKLLFFQTNWGNQLTWDAFCERAKSDGFGGIDIWLPSDKKSQDELKAAIEKYDLLLNLMHGTNKRVPFDKSVKQFTEKLKVLIEWNPTLINCHTGSDFFTFEQNQVYINIANQLAKEHQIPIYHETHRGRFSYNLPDTQKYIDEIPDLRLTLDISHWMVVHESLLIGKDKQLADVIERTDHIHARVGYAEGPQVNDPAAPEWKRALDRHLDIWEEIIRKGWKENNGVFTITSEFGPADYMHTIPYTKVPIADQWKANVFIMNAIKKRMNVK